MSAPSPIRIDDNLTTCKSGIAVGTADDKSACRVYMQNKVVIDQRIRNDPWDEMLPDIIIDLLLRNIFIMLRRYHHRMDAARSTSVILVFQW